MEIHPLTPERWSDLVTLFERLGPRGGRPVTSACWCMFWRLTPKEFSAGWGKGERRGVGNRQALKQLIDEGITPGLLAYMRDEPVGWLSLGPRTQFPRLERSRDLAPIDDKPVWSIVCFYIDPRHRGAGISEALLSEAVRYAADHGARLIEGYGCRPGDADPFTGMESTFQVAGFELARKGRRRAIMRRPVRSTGRGLTRRPGTRQRPTPDPTENLG